MSKLTEKLFNVNDNPLLKYNLDDGMKVEPEWYIPILPLVLINGTEGIGTGFSTKIPAHNPIDIIKNIYSLMNGKPYKEMKPWFRGFKGTIDFKTISEIGNDVYMNKGVYKKLKKNILEITELPIGTWTDNYKEFLDSIIYDKQADARKQKKQCIVKYKSYYTESKVKFVITFRKNELQEFIEDNVLEQLLKLSDTKNTSYNNMHLYNAKGTIEKYDSVKKILLDYYKLRLEYYDKRKDYLLNKYKDELIVIGAKIKFIKEFIDKKIEIIRKEDEEIYKQLQDRKYPVINNDNKYDYLLNMSIRTLTKKRMDELQKQFDVKTNIRNKLLSKSNKIMWKEDIINFMEEYNKFVNKKE